MMLEDLFQYIWKMKLFDSSNLQTTAGESITIVQVGMHNLNAGPDFFNAKIKIDNTLWAGNVELHVKSSDWLLHKHQNDLSFQNIILHVVYLNDKPLFYADGTPIKTLVLKDHIPKEVINKYKTFKEHHTKIACEKSISHVPKAFVHTYLEKIIVSRLAHKSQHIENLLAENQNNWEQSFYMQLAANFGFKVNQVPFELLARNTPLSIIAKHKGNLQQLEALLFGQAGFLNDTFTESYPLLLQNEYAYLKKKYQLNGIDGHLWKLSRMRPVNFPTIRIAQFAALIHQSSHLFSKIIATQAPTELIKLFKVAASPYWDNHYTFNASALPLKKNIGNTAIENLIINTIVPFIFVYGKHYGNEEKCELALQLLEKINPEKNTITQLWNALGIKAENALQSQALIELKNNHCDLKKCLQCGIGHFIIKNN
jgi:hypothetical protein